MSTTTTTPNTTELSGTKPAAASQAVDESLYAGPLRKPLSLVGGVAMIAAPLLIVAGLMTSPPQVSRATGDYITALARDPFLTSLSANLLHYGWVAMALGFVIAMTLVRGRQGRVLSLVGGVAGGFSIVQMSALMYNDWVLAALGNNLDLASATRAADAYMQHGDVSQVFAWKCATAALVLPVFLYAGLARAGVISWFVVPLALLPMIAPFLVMSLFGSGASLIEVNPLGVAAGSLTGLVCYLPTFLVGLRLIGRARMIKA